MPSEPTLGYLIEQLQLCEKDWDRAKAMYDNEKELHAAGPFWRIHKSAKMGNDQGWPYHPGAIAFARGEPLESQE